MNVPKKLLTLALVIIMTFSLSPVQALAASSMKCPVCKVAWASAGAGYNNCTFMYASGNTCNKPTYFYNCQNCRYTWISCGIAGHYN